MALTERYVTTTGAGAHDGTSEANAWSWAEMIAAAQPAQGYRINIKAGTYDLSAGAVTLSGAGPWVLQGYTTTIGDKGKATLSFGATTGDFFTVSGANSCFLVDLIFASTASSGTGDGVRMTGAGGTCIRCVTYGWYNNGFEFAATAGGHVAMECEAYDCNRAGSVLKAGFVSAYATIYVRCASHHNDEGGDVDCHGFYSGNAPVHFVECIAHSNSGHGFYTIQRAPTVYLHCDSYLNALDGFHNEASTYFPTGIFLSCNSIDNTGDGFEVTDNLALGWLESCGDYSNANRTAGSGEFIDDGPVTYSAVPYDDATNGNFTLDQANGAGGRGTARALWQTTGYSSGTTGYRDIGASHHTPPTAANTRYGVEVRDTTGLLEIPNSGTPTGTQDETSDACVVSGKKYGSPQRTGSAAGGGGLLSHAGMNGGLNG